MVLAVHLTVWHLLYIPLVGCGVASILYLVFKIAPTKQAPQYILDLEKDALVGGRMTMIAEQAAEELSREVEHEKPASKYRTTIDDEVLTAYNKYKAICAATKKTPDGLSAWVKTFDPDLYKRVFPED